MISAANSPSFIPEPLTGKSLRDWQQAEIVRALAFLAEPGQVVEMCIPKVGGRSNRTASGYFNDPKALTAAAVNWSGCAAGVYVTLNPVNPALLARAANRAVDYALTTTSDADIVRRRNLLIDADPTRPSGISSTDPEHDSALERAAAIQSWLSDRGWPAPLRADSGNGGHLVYGIDLPNDEASAQLIERCLQAIRAEWGDDAISIDTTIYNVGRISKLYGTAACKGDSIPERPHRLSRILDAPDALIVVNTDLLRDLATLAPNATTKRLKRGQHAVGVDLMRDQAILARYANAQDTQRDAYTGSAFDVASFIDRHRSTLNPSPPKDLSNGTVRWRIDCIANSEHKGDAVIGQRADGAVWVKCSHASCEGRWGWRELREKLEPDEPPDDHPREASDANAPYVGPPDCEATDEPPGDITDEEAVPYPFLEGIPPP